MVPDLYVHRAALESDSEGFLVVRIALSIFPLFGVKHLTVLPFFSLRYETDEFD